MADIVITEFMDEASVARLSSSHDVQYDPGLVDKTNALLDAVGSAKALIVRNRTQVRGDILAAAPNLTCVGRLGVGLDNIDVAACEAAGVTVYPATGANDLAVAEYVVATAMMLLRGAYLATADVVAGAWPRTRLMGRETAGQTLGLVGCGAIARLTAGKAKALGMDVIGFDPFVPADSPVWTEIGRRDLTGVLKEADVVSLHVPLTDETRGLIGADALRLMKPDAVLINAARGGVVDEGALVDALKGGRIGGAALDVFEKEPLTADAGQLFAGVSNVILTPHIAGVTTQSNVRVSDLIADRVLAHLEG